MDHSMDLPIIAMDHVSKTYPTGIKAVNDLNLKIEKGEFVFIVGRSGSGKSTLVKLLLKEIEPEQGRIYVNGGDVGRLKRRQVPSYRRNIGVVFQDFRLLKDRNVFDNVALAGRVIGTSNHEISRQVPRMLSIVGLADKMHALPRELSGGEQQRVALARALVNKPILLLADEPTGNLDPKNSWEIMSLLEEVNKNGTTIVVVTHNREIVDTMKKRVITMKKGILAGDQKKGGYNYEKD